MIKLSDKEFAALTGYIKSNFGIDLGKKRTLIEGRMNNYLIKLGYDDFTSYLDMLFADKTGHEVTTVVNYLTTNYTYFLRERENFDFYKNTILPYLKQTYSKTKDLRIWSAACSSGEEPYTLAMITDEFFGAERGQWDKKILATDISERVLALAREGVYNGESLEKVPPSWQSKYFNRLDTDTWQMKPEIRSEVIFRFFNLMEPVFPFRRKFHVIFCRNVMIYFDAETKRQLIERFYNATEDGGYLVIGQSESVDRAVSRYKYIIPSVYRKEGGI